MSETHSNPEYPPGSQNLFHSHSVPVKYPELNEPSTTPLESLPPSRPTTPVQKSPVGFSGKDPMFSFSARVDNKTPVNVKLDNVGKLTGQDNYRIWSASMNIVPMGIKAHKVVVDGVSPADDAVETETDAFEQHTASTIFLQEVSQDILEKIVELEDRHLMWT